MYKSASLRLVRFYARRRPLREDFDDDFNINVFPSQTQSSLLLALHCTAKVLLPSVTTNARMNFTIFDVFLFAPRFVASVLSSRRPRAASPRRRLRRRRGVVLHLADTRSSSSISAPPRRRRHYISPKNLYRCSAISVSRVPSVLPSPPKSLRLLVDTRRLFGNPSTVSTRSCCESP